MDKSLENRPKISIKKRLMRSFVLIIVITVFVLEISLINGIIKYYHTNMEDVLTNQLDFSLNYLKRYLKDESLEDIIIDDIDLFWNQTPAQVQVLNREGDLLFDSLGSQLENTSIQPDIVKALGGGKGVTSGRNNLYNEKVLSISKPINIENEILGVLRFTTSLEETNAMIREISLLLMVLGLIVIGISILVSFFLANSIIKPLEEVTKTAKIIASGRLDVRSEVDVEDEIGQLSKTLNYMTEELIKKDNIKNEFISSVSHELKTPLTSIKGWAITLQMEDLMGNEIIREGLEIIESESDRLSEMVDEILDFSSFDLGRIKLNKEKINIPFFLGGIYKQLLPRAELNKLRFEIYIDEELDYLVGDKARLRQVLINILDNAFKFSKASGKIKLKALKEDDKLKVVIKDNGIGIRGEDLPYIKERFFKGNIKGANTGIGLAISEEIIKLHLGELNISSKLDIGTTVEVLIPLGVNRDE